MADKLLSVGHDGGLDEQFFQSFFKRAGPDAAYFYIPCNGSAYIESAQYEVISKLGDAKLEPQDSDKFHITLMIVDKIKDDQVEEFFDRLSPIMPLQFQVTATEIITFQNADSVPVVLRIDPSPSLLRLQSELWNLATSMKLPIGKFSDPRQFKPHITLGMGLEPRDAPIYQLDRPFTVPVDSFVVTRGGYKKIWTVELPTMDKDRILVTVDEREGEAVIESFVNQEVAISRSSLISLLRGEPLLLGELNRVVTLEDGPFVIYNDGEPIRRIAPPEPVIEGLENEPEPIVEKTVIETVKEQIFGALRKFAYNMTKMISRGGEGSGHFGHEGRPGEVGGSLPSGVQEELFPKPSSLGKMAGNVKKFMERILGMRNAIIHPKTDIDRVDSEDEFKKFENVINSGAWGLDATGVMRGAVEDLLFLSGEPKLDQLEELRMDYWEELVDIRVDASQQVFAQELDALVNSLSNYEELRNYIGVSDEEFKMLSDEEIDAMIFHRHMVEYLTDDWPSRTDDVIAATQSGPGDNMEYEYYVFNTLIQDFMENNTPMPDDEAVTSHYRGAANNLQEVLGAGDHRLYVGYDNDSGDIVSAAYVHIFDDIPEHYLGFAREANESGRINVNMEDIEGHGYIYLDRIGSQESGHGYGTEQMLNVLSMAYDLGYGIFGNATSTAKPFYDKLGATWINRRGRYGGGVGLWTPSEVQRAGDFLKRFGMGEALEVRSDDVTDQDIEISNSGFRILELFDLDDPEVIAYKPTREDYKAMFVKEIEEVLKSFHALDGREVVVKGHLRRIIIQRGGPGSGHFGHEGRPGEVGGSKPSGEAVRPKAAWSNH